MLTTITAHQVCAAYDFLSTFSPFSEWKLPPSSEIEFQVVLDPKLLGWHKCKSNGTHIIAISERGSGHVTSLLLAVAHEMTHLSQVEHGTATKAAHNKDFHDRAKLVSLSLGFDPRQFV